MATYNGARYLPEQLASLAAQTVSPAELIVADDGSTDATHSILRDFALHAPFRVSLLAPAARLGPTGAFARAMAGSGGDVVAFCDQDDFWAPSKLAALRTSFADPSVAVVLCDARLVNSNLQPLGLTLWEQIGFKPVGSRLSHPELTLMGQTIAFGLTMAYRNTEMVRSHLLPIPPRFGHDNWTALVAAALGDVALIGQAHVDYRQHADQVSSAGRTGRVSLRDHVTERLRPRNPSLVPNATAIRALIARLDSIQSAERGRAWAVLRSKAEGLAAHVDVREALPEGQLLAGGLARAPRVAREVLSGNYRRHSNGWRSAVRDLIWGPDTTARA